VVGRRLEAHTRVLATSAGPHNVSLHHSVAATNVTDRRSDATHV
jgi:hypothetical protein